MCLPQHGVPPKGRAGTHGGGDLCFLCNLLPLQVHIQDQTYSYYLLQLPLVRSHYKGLKGSKGVFSSR